MPKVKTKGTQRGSDEGRAGEPNAKMRAFEKYRRATRFLLASVFRSWRQFPAAQLKQLQPPQPLPRPPPPPPQLLPSFPPPLVADQPMAQAANRAKRPAASPKTGKLPAGAAPKRTAAPVSGLPPFQPLLLPPALPQSGPAPGRPSQLSRPSPSSPPSVNDVIAHKMEEALLAKKRDELCCMAGTIAELVSADVSEVWSSMMNAEGAVEEQERAQGIERAERYKLERRQVWLEKFVQSKLDEGVTIKGHLR